MAPGDTQPLESDWRLSPGTLDSIAPRREASLLLLGPWDWLEQLRFRFDIAIELLDRQRNYVLPAAPSLGRLPDIRRALAGPEDDRLREAAAAVSRTAKPKSLSAARLHIRMFPLFGGWQAPRSIVGLLLLGIAMPADAAADADAIAAAERRLDAAAHWLTAAIEANIDATALRGDTTRSTERLSTMIDLVETLRGIDDDRQIVELTVEALAMWYDADVRGYRQDVSGAFALETWLPGIDVAQAVRRLPRSAVWERQDVFRLESPRDSEDLGWDVGVGDTLFVPLAIGDVTEWLLTVSGADEPTIEATLAFLGRVVGMFLTVLDREAVDRARRMVSGRLVLNDAPFDIIVRMGLESLAASVKASAAHVNIYYDTQPTPVASIGWGSLERDPGFIEAGSHTTTDHALACGAVAGAGMTAAFAFEKQIGVFSAADLRVVQSAAAIFGTWLSGTFLRRAEIARPVVESFPSDVVAQLRGSVDREGRAGLDGVLAVVEPEADRPTRVELDELVLVVRNAVRSFDTVGIVSDRAVAALLIDVEPRAATAIGGRLSRMAHAYGVSAVRIGVTAFTALSETPDSILDAAFSNARRGGARS